MDRGNLHKRNGAKSTWAFIYSQELGQDDRLAYEVSFRRVRRTMSEEHRTSRRLRDKPGTEVLVTQSWESFPSRQIFALCVTGSPREKLSTKVVSLLRSYSPLVEWRNIWLHICILSPDNLTITQHLQQAPTKIFLEDITATDYNEQATLMREFLFAGRY